MVSETKQSNRIAIQNNRTCKKKDKSMKRDEQREEKKTNKHSMEWKLFKFKSNLSYFLLFLSIIIKSW